MSTLKKTLLALTSLTALSLAGAGIFISTIDPNDYKNELSTYFSEKAGFQISLNGDIRLTLFPNPSLSLANVQFTKQDNGRTLESVLGQTQLHLNWAPLLKRNLVVESLTIKDLKLNVISDPKIVATSTVTLVTSANQTDVNKTTDSKVESASNKSIDFNIKKLTLSNGSLIHNDKVSGQEIMLSDIKMDLGSLSPTTPIQLKGKLNASISNTLNKSDIQFEILANRTQTDIDIQKALFTGRLAVKDMPPVNLNIDILGKLILGKSFSFNTFDVTLNGTKMNGTLTGLIADNPKLIYNFNTSKLDATYLQTGTASQMGVPAATALPPLPAPTLPNADQKELLRSSFTIQALVGDDWVATNVSSKLAKTQNELRLSNLELDVYQGHLKSDLVLQGDKIIANGQLNQVNIQALLTELKNFKKLTGAFSTTFNIETKGKDLDARLKAMKGQMDFNLDNGFIEGIDMSYIFHELKAKLKKQENPKTDMGKTEFAKAMGQMKFLDGMVYTDNLTIVSNDYRALGKGTFKHDDQYLDLNFDVAKLNDDEEVVKEIPIGLKVYGHAPDIHIKPDYEGYALSVAKKTMTKKAEKVVDKLLDKLGLDPSGTAPPGTYDENNPPPPSEPLTDKINDKVKSKINKFLDKL